MLGIANDLTHVLPLPVMPWVQSHCKIFVVHGGPEQVLRLLQTELAPPSLVEVGRHVTRPAPRAGPGLLLGW